MFLCTKKYLKQFDSGNQDIFFSFNMHPKVMTPEHFQALEKYHKKLTGHYKGTIQAISFQQAAAILRRNLLNDNDVNVANNVSTQKEVFLNFQMTRTKRINQEMYEALKKI